jgi:hypothetical protein
MNAQIVRPFIVEEKVMKGGKIRNSWSIKKKPAAASQTHF